MRVRMVMLPMNRVCWGALALEVGFFACGVGLSLNWYWFISVAPVRGTHLLSLPRQRK
jgi:hypothetical protein